MEHAIDTFTGIRPTADLTVANYLGAVKPILDRERANPVDSSAVFLAELHAATTERPSVVRAHSLELTRTLIACGVRGEVYSQQSLDDLVMRTELSLRGLVRVSELLRQPTLKDKIRSTDNPDSATVALSMYPVLMASDIILARPSEVPTGQDQRGHLELTNKLIRRFNSTFDAELPEPYNREVDPVNVLSLDGSGRKMSKSMESGAIYLDGTPDEAKRRVMRAVTASEPGEALDRSVDNLLYLGQQLHGDTFVPDAELDELAQAVKNGERVTKKFKLAVAENVAGFIGDMQHQRAEVSDQDVLDRINRGNQYIHPIAKETDRYISERYWAA
jgi:tryptophanyl-tRNA synthetase